MPRDLSLVRYLAAAYAALALLAGAARFLPSMSAAVLAVATVALAVPPIAGLWHRGAVRRLERLHQFAADRWLARWAGRRAIEQACSAIAALVLTATVVLQSPWFGALEWALLAAAPLVFVACRRATLVRARALFSRNVYAANGAGAVARALTFATLCVLWAAGRYALPPGEARPLGEAIYALQTAWPATATAFARWAMEAGAWGEATLAMLAGTQPMPWWRIALVAVFVPLTVFGYATWSAAGCAVDTAGWRRTLGAPLSDADVPAAVGRSRLMRYGVGAALSVVAVVLAFQWADAALGRQPRWLALEAVPQCERIGSRMYSLGTLAKVEAYTSVIEEGMRARRATACARIADIRRIAEANVDAYLDWYFSLGGDWTRLVLMLSGDVEAVLEVKFSKLVASDPRIRSILGELQLDQQYLLEVASLGRNGLVDLLEQERLVLDERQCRAVADPTRGALALRRRDGRRDRALASAAIGAVTGAIAGAVTARAMSRASMQAAGRVMGRAAAKRGVGRAGAAAAGAALGTAAAPGVGTIAGLVAGAATDVAMLAAEEKLTRADMRLDLLSAVDETLSTLRNAFDCPGR
jgi:hypothetical protein